MLQFGDIEPFLTANRYLSFFKTQNARNFAQCTWPWSTEDGASCCDRHWQQFERSTYNLEGDGELKVNCYEEIVKLLSLISSAYCPNTTADSQSLSP